MISFANIGLVGDYNPQVTAHIAIPKALNMVGEQTGATVEYSWLPTDELTVDGSNRLSSFDGLWCVPASPYKNMDGALLTIRFARENDVPFLGTCGGYQHAVLEFAQNVLGYTDAGNMEVDPETPMPLIAPMSCALVEKEGEILLTSGSQIADIYGSLQINEKYRCSYGFNPQYRSIFDGSDLFISGVDKENEPRVIEIKNRPFFIGTAFQPERSALSGNTHPLISAFIKACSG